MDENLLQIFSYDGAGFRPLAAYNGWRVAILNYLDGIHPERNNKMERHTETDEVFVLLKGQGILVIGGNSALVEGIYPQEMETGVIYNVRSNAWHTILLSRDASVLIVEQADTGERNSEYTTLSAEFHSQVVEIANRNQNLA